MNELKNNNRPINVIAYEIKKEWQNVYFDAVPYLDAMLTLNTVKDCFYEDSAKSIIIYFLANAQTFRGEMAKALKTELKNIIK